MKAVDVLEKEFDKFFQSIGLRRISEFVGQSPSFKNADYIDLEQRVVFELKVLDKDFFAEGGIIHRFNSLVPFPVNIDEKGFGQYTIKFPDLNRKGRHDTFEEPIRKIIKNANKQLKETKSHFFQGSGFGFVLYAMNNFKTLHPDIVFRMLGELTGEGFTSTDGFILCTPSYFGIPQLSNPVCIPGTPIDSPIELVEYMNSVGQAWCDFYNSGGHT